MKRRDFFKGAGIFTAGCMAGGLTEDKAGIKIPFFNKNTLSDINTKDDKQNNKNTQKGEKGWLRHIEISLAYHCNLNCASCYHCAPIAPKYFMPLDIFEKDIKRIYDITKGKIYSIMLLGGEPLLNKNVEKYIKITRGYFKESEIILFTNSLLLNNMSDNFYKTCSENKITIRHSIYPLYENYPNLEPAYRKADSFNTNLTSYAPRYKFVKMLLSKQKTNDKVKTYNTCVNKIKCSVLDHGLIYPCQVIASAKLFLNEYFKDQAIPVEENDYLDIYKISSVEEINNFYKIPKEFCKYCHNSSNNAVRLWGKSKKELSEWYDV